MNKKTPKQPHEYRVNPLQFMNNFTPESAYILGLIWSDGNIYTCKKRGYHSVSFATTHPDALYFKEIFKETGDWNIYDGKPGQQGWKQPCSIQTNNQMLGDFLIKNDYQAKSGESADKILNFIPENLKHYFYLGELDGDGCISVDRKRWSYNIQFSSVYNQDWKFMEVICKKLDIDYSIRRTVSWRGHKSSSFYIYGTNKAIQFCNYIYQDYDENNIGLPRKHEKYLKLKEISRKRSYKGVCFRKPQNKWEAYSPVINSDITTRIGLGFYDKKSDAERVVIEWLKTNMPEKYEREYVSNR